MKPVGVILAAGRGVRLGELTAEIPKGLLKVGNATLISRQIDALRENGIEDIYVVVGFAAEKVEKAFEDEVGYIYNSKWNTTNNIYSLYLAREVASDGFILINSDDLFDRGILKGLLDDPYPDCICVDDYKKLGEEEMKVKLENGHLREINKTMSAATAQGEYIGVAKFGKEGAAELFAVIEDFVRADDLDGWYEEAFGVLSKRRNIKAVSAQKLPWIEIDTPADLNRAAKEILPKIERGGGGK